MAVLDVSKLRGWWAHRQGLCPALGTTTAPAEVLAQTGWARSVGGCGPYLTLFSRTSLSREATDRAVANLEIHELPAARGCTYVVPAADYELALRLSQNAGYGEMRTAEKLGVTNKEIDKLCQAVLVALEKGPLEPDGIRDAARNAVRSLGAEGQKKGLSSTLPVALERLQNDGHIRRIPTNGRLDQQRYKYALWRPNPLEDSKIDGAHAAMELARKFFRWIGPAQMAEFQTFAGLGVKAAKAAVEPLKLEAIAKDDDRLLMAEDRAAFEDFKLVKDACYHLVGNLDSSILPRRDLTALIDEKDREHPMLARQSSLAGLAGPGIVDRGRIVGLWEFDPESQTIVYALFVKKNAALSKAIATTEEYVRTQLGDARSFSLDSPKSRAPRIELLRSLS